MTAPDSQQAQANAPKSQPAAAPGQVFCPDPAAHGNKDKKLQDHASTAALYATNPERAKVNPLGPDGKLSSASAATSLKYAQAKDLPSYPTVGIDTSNSAGSAALLAHGNKTKIEWWKPEGTSDHAAKAALLAKDYKMAPMWKPELSAAGSKAALLAHRDGGKLDLWIPEASAEGNSAAGIALRNKTLSPQLDYGYTKTGKANALTAATGALAGGRKRAGSTPVAVVPDYPDAANSAANSLSAATIAHKPSMKSKEPNRMSSAALESARITHAGANVPREMYGSAPPVSLEVEEQRRQDALRASAISMAKKMYDTQQTHINAAAGASSADAGAKLAHARQPSTASSVDIKQQAMQYISLQEQAQKLAAERLAKLDPDEAAVFRSYYGYGDKTHRSRLSVRNRNRGRASSEGGRRGEAVDSDDEEQSRRIRNQMSTFNNQLAAVDAKKQQKDRESLLAAAERKVHAQMHNMDEKVFMETGKVSPAMMEEWEARARAKAAEDSEARLANHGKIHVGGGKFLDQSEIDAIAAARMQPTLDEIADKAATQRAKDEENRLDAEEKKRLATVEREREAEMKAEGKRLKNEEKAAEKQRKADEKAAAKTEKEAEKARREEEKRMSKEEKRRSKNLGKGDTAAAVPVVVEPAAEAAHDHGHEAAVDRSTEPETEPAVEEPTTTTKTTARPTGLATNPSYRADIEAIGDASSSGASSPSSPAEDLPTTHNHAQTVAHRVATAPETSTVDHADPLPTTADTGTTLARRDRDAAADDEELASPLSPSVSATEGRGFKSLFSRLKRRSRAGTSGSEGSASAASARSGSRDGGNGRRSFLGRKSGDGGESFGSVSGGGTGGFGTTATAVGPVGGSTAAEAREVEERQRDVQREDEANADSDSISSLSSDEGIPAFGAGTASVSPPSSAAAAGADKTSGSGSGRVAAFLGMAGFSSSSDKDTRGRPSTPRRESAISALSSDGDEFEEARDGFDEGALEGGLEEPPRGVLGGGLRKDGAGSPVRSTRFKESF